MCGGLCVQASVEYVVDTRLPWAWAHCWDMQTDGHGRCAVVVVRYYFAGSLWCASITGQFKSEWKNAFSMKLFHCSYVQILREFISQLNTSLRFILHQYLAGERRKRVCNIIGKFSHVLPSADVFDGFSVVFKNSLWVSIASLLQYSPTANM